MRQYIPPCADSPRGAPLSLSTLSLKSLYAGYQSFLTSTDEARLDSAATPPVFLISGVSAILGRMARNTVWGKRLWSLQRLVRVFCCEAVQKCVKIEGYELSRHSLPKSVSKGLATGFAAALLKLNRPSQIVPTFVSKMLEEVLKQEYLSYTVSTYHRRLRPLEAGLTGALGGYVKGLVAGKDPFQELVLGFVGDYFFELFVRIYSYLSEDKQVISLLVRVFGKGAGEAAEGEDVVETALQMLGVE